MSGKDADRWRMPELERLGERFRAAEMAEREAERGSWWRRRRSWLRRGVAGLLGVLAATAGVLELVAPAGAKSPVNRAPIAAEDAGSVQFIAAQDITVDGRRVTTVRETGALDFASRAYATRLTVGETTEPLERRRIGATLYFRRSSAVGSAGPPRKWSAVRIASTRPGLFALPGGYTMTDPEVVFQVMTRAISPPQDLGSRIVDGVQTRGYAVPTTLQAFLAAEHGEASRQPSTHSTGALAVWVDTYGRPVRVEVRFHNRSHFGAATMTTVVDFSAYGAPVLVATPPRDERLPTTRHYSTSALEDPVRAVERLLFGTR